MKDKSLLVGTYNTLYRVDGAIDMPVSVEEDGYSLLPASYSLHQNYPNPFNPSTTIEFTLPDRSHIRLAVYNVIGQEVATLIDEEVSAGTHRTTWDASGLPSGIYFVRIEAHSDRSVGANAFTATKKMVLLR